ncbi:alpha/beta hydrolase [Nonomuraea candida]|uniref:alpha/beta hydrolase n=1 Tax=Nonomuraea candida TaxID=359159 RepID=UPI000A0456BF|nr:alpha/beta hydrolase [Nonomuraea candida]
MNESREYRVTGVRGRNMVREWPRDRPRYVALLIHGYGEHVGRYEYVADRLVRHGAAVYGVDHVGHGKSGGERALIEDFEDVVTDVHTVEERAREDHPGVPVVAIGHSMGGMIAARYAQRYGAGLAALVLSAPVIGRWEVVSTLLSFDEIPDAPLDPSMLSRDPSVGEAAGADPLVWTGAFRRATLEAFVTAMATIAKGGTFGDLPTLWLHGEDDKLVPPGPSREGLDAVRGSYLTERLYPGDHFGAGRLEVGAGHLGGIAALGPRLEPVVANTVNRSRKPPVFAALLPVRPFARAISSARGSAGPRMGSLPAGWVMVRRLRGCSGPGFVPVWRDRPGRGTGWTRAGLRRPA